MYPTVVTDDERCLGFVIGRIKSPHAYGEAAKPLAPDAAAAIFALPSGDIAVKVLLPNGRVRYEVTDADTGQVKGTAFTLADLKGRFLRIK
jgi:hypothetical protein